MRFKFKFIALLIFQLVSYAFAAETDLSKSSKEKIDALVHEEMEKQDAVGLAIGVINNGEIVYLQQYGYSDLKKKQKVSLGTKFRWASIGKPLAAVAAMQLAEEGKLDLDVDIRKYVPEFPDKGVKITTRQLLSHLGGIVHYSNGPVVKTKRSYDSKHPYQDVILALDTFKESPLVCKPGEKFSYTSHGYILLSAVIQRAGDEKFADQVKNRICRPLKLRTLQPDYQWKRITNRAKGYKKKTGEVIESTDTDVSWKLGAGGWISSINDLAQFAKALLGEDFVSEEVKKQMWRRQNTSDGSLVGYGLGFRLSGSYSEDNLVVEHDGLQEKARSLMRLKLKENDGVVIMSNSEYINPYKFADLIFKILEDE